MSGKPESLHKFYVDYIWKPYRTEDYITNHKGVIVRKPRKVEFKDIWNICKNSSTFEQCAGILGAMKSFYPKRKEQFHIYYIFDPIGAYSGDDVWDKCKQCDTKTKFNRCVKKHGYRFRKATD